MLDRMSYQRFCGLENSNTITDRTTIWKFENRIMEVGAKTVFQMEQQLLKHGFIAQCGQMISARIVPAPKQHCSKDEQKTLAEGNIHPAWTEAKHRQKDVDASWTKKHGKSYFGYKISINADKRYKLIRKMMTGTDAAHDSQHFDALLSAVGNNTNQDVYANRGYASLAREAKLKATSYRGHFEKQSYARLFEVPRSCIQRKGSRGHPLSARGQRRNHRIATPRTR